MAAVLLLALGVAASAVQAAPAGSDDHYVGEARVTDLVTGAVTTEPVALLRRATPPLVVETACTASGGRAMASTMYLTREGQHLDVSNRAEGPGAVRGDGAIFEQPGRTYLRLSMRFTLPGRELTIEDRNILTSGRLIARKTIFSAPDSPVQLWEAELPRVDATAYRAAVAKIGCAG